MSEQDSQSDWADQIPYSQRPTGPYEDFGWEPQTSVLPEFRDPSVHLMPYEIERIRRRARRDSGRMSSRGANRGSSEQSQSRRMLPAPRSETGPYVGRGPRNYRRADTRIHDDVSDRLAMHGWIDASHMTVQVKDGEVTLSGTVNTREEKRLAEDLAYDVFGVSDVRNQLQVRQQDGRE